jgi:hypothetical protein
VTKFSFLLFLCLLCFRNLSAQTDSTPSRTAVPVERSLDTTIPAPRPHTLSRKDSVRHDSIARVNSILRHEAAARRDSLRRDSSARQAVVIRPDSTSTRDTLKGTGVVPAASAAAASDKDKGPAALTFWKAVLTANPFFNFLGQPVRQQFELHRANSKDSLFYLLLGILFYFALVRIFFEKYFGNLMTLFFRVSLRQQQIREQVLQTPLPSLLLNFLFIITGGLYACFLLHYSRFAPTINFWLLYVNCMVGLGVIYLVKFLVLKFCGWVFNIARATDTYIFIVFLVNKMLGIFLLPFLILITFSGPSAREIFITISLVMVFVLLMYRVLAAFRPVRNEIKLTPFHFFLYLCAFEIAPLLLIYKVLLAYLEKVY